MKRATVDKKNNLRIVEEEETPKNSDYRPNPLLVPFSIVIAGALIAGAIIYNGRVGNAGTSATTSAATTTATPPAISTTTVTVSIAGAHTEGNKDAKVAFVEFSDYECPYCQKLFQDTIPSLRKDYVNNNKVLHVFKNFPLTSIHPLATIGAEAAECAGEQGKYWEMHDKIYSAADQSKNDQSALEQYAKDLGLNSDQFNSCVTNNKYANTITNDSNDGNKINVQGTPTVVVGTIDHKKNTVTGNVIYGAYPYSTFQTALAKYL